MNINIEPKGNKWELTKTGQVRGELFTLRRDAIAEAKKRAKGTKNVIFVRNARGMVVVRIPEKLTNR